jgi:ribosomal protein S18 acetylase RimI-like enzyme
MYSTFRGRKVGDALLSRVAVVARDEGCFGIMLNVLGWNQSAIGFFRTHGAKLLGDWKTARFDGDAAQVLAARQ